MNAKNQIDAEVLEWENANPSIKPNMSAPSKLPVSIEKLIDTTDQLTDKLIKYGKYENS